jgi:ribosomal protein L7Ae-like RNA K-turn-binding protein
MAASSAELASKISVARKQEAVNYENLSNDAELGNQVGLGFAKVGAAIAGTLAGSVAGPGAAVATTLAGASAI